MKVLLLRFDAPLMSFGAAAIDQHGVVQRFPALSMLTGLLGNALGFHHGQSGRLDQLQDRLRFAARLDRRGVLLRDYQTVNLGADWMVPEKAGWTTRGRVSTRGGASGDGTHQRYRDYRADSLCTVGIGLHGTVGPTLDELADAVRYPARPLFIGRKTCLPAAPVFVAVTEAPTLLAAVATYPRSRRADAGPLPANWWDDGSSEGAGGEWGVFPVTDERDWANRIHAGRRLMRHGFVNPPEEQIGA